MFYITIAYILPIMQEITKFYSDTLILGLLGTINNCDVWY